jgi:2-desacetyl-2-hydroxyethyl bacteriochlorophyllide A dehydrogenase
MERAILDRPGAFRVESAPLPEVRPDHVRLRISVAGICGSDIHTYLGENPAATTPIAPGHEFSGVVEVVGDGVSHVKPGDLVAARPSVPCGTCFYCRNGEEHLCSEMQFVGGPGYDGAFAQYVVLPGACVYAVDKSVGADVVAFAEPTAVAVHTVDLVGDVARTQVLVIGCGTIGLLVAQVGLHAGASVTVSDLVKNKVDLAVSLGASPAALATDAPARLLTTNDHLRPFDTVFDCVGSNATLAIALESVKKGGTVVLVGVPTGAIELDPLSVLLGERHLIGSYIYRNRDFEEALDLISRGTISIRPLITSTLPLAQIGAAFELAASGNERIKLLLDPWTTT